ncbi:MAG: hypothetical protein ACREXS_00680 [Gammaproteobacteria bacterium]
MIDLGGGEQSLLWVSGSDPSGHWRTEVSVNSGPWVLYQLVLPADRDVTILGVASAPDRIQGRVRGEAADFTPETEWAISNDLQL